MSTISEVRQMCREAGMPAAEVGRVMTAVSAFATATMQTSAARALVDAWTKDRHGPVCVWACEPPPQGATFVVRRESWNDNYTVRTIEAFDLVDIAPPPATPGRYYVKNPMVQQGEYFTVEQLVHFHYYDGDGRFIRTEAAPPHGWHVTVGGVEVTQPPA